MRDPTHKQQCFVEEYLIDLNATQAAIRAGYSKKTAEVQGYQLLQKTLVRAAIDKAMAERSERAHVDQDMVIEGLLKEAQFHGDGASHSARVGAWGHLGKHLGMFLDRHEHSGPGVGLVSFRMFVQGADDG